MVVSSGTSMEPGVHAGDLIVVRRQSGYDAGDVVAYRSPDLGTVLHRIVDIEGAGAGRRYVMQGDNNDFIDAVQPTDEMVIGAMQVVVPHGGKLLGLLPVIVAGALSLWFFAQRDRTGGHTPVRQPLSARKYAGVALLVVCGVGVVVVTMAHPSTTRTRAVPNRTDVTVTWGARAEPSPVYPTGRVSPGDPVFLHEVDTISIDAAVHADERAVDVMATMELLADVHDENGWHHEIALDGPRPFAGSAADLEGTLDLGALRVLLDQVASRTGATPGQYDVDVVVAGTVHGTLAGQSFEEPVAHTIPLVLDELTLRPTAEADWDTHSLSEVEVSETVEATLGAGSLAMPVSTLRVLAPIGMLLGLLLVLLGRREVPPHVTMNRRISASVVEVQEAMLPPGTPTVAVDSFEDLRRVAELEGVPILHHEADGHHWAAFVMGVWYSFALKAAIAAET